MKLSTMLLSQYQPLHHDCRRIQNKGSQHPSHERTLVQLVVHSALTVYTALGHSDWIAHNAFLCVVLILHKHAFITYMYLPTVM